MRSFGAEEEMLLIDPGTGAAVALAEAVTDGAGDDAPESELQRQQVETDTAPCVSLSELSDQVRAARRAAGRGHVYFDARLSRHYPTVEIRVADVCLRADDAVLLAETGELAAVVRAAVERTLDA